ncbi:hypothetical protein [Salipiger mucosus]|uniref:Uncharacterized protein n=1 Tax=Salipiger mucosus DSM 16094 TaxID=1123237 RepID=S9S3J8_9RHOB|nr:hypothetical protein [Salipiger mucosus]EPX84775.1 hypothetical protein Salmuc_01348 [Salipiger mucosus DSM 16094]
MYPENEAQRADRQQHLKELCEPLGLEVDGDTVTARIGDKAIQVDASAVNTHKLVPCLMYLARTNGGAPSNRLRTLAFEGGSLSRG